MQTIQKPGTMLRSYLRWKAQKTALLPITDPSARALPKQEPDQTSGGLAVVQGPQNTDNLPTLYVPVVNRENTPPPGTPKIPYVMYSAIASPITLLTGACMEALRRYRRPPVQLFIAPELEPVLDRETEIATEVPYDRHFRLYRPSAIGKFRIIPVYLDRDLPDAIYDYIGGHLSRETVVALCVEA